MTESVIFTSSDGKHRVVETKNRRKLYIGKFLTQGSMSLEKPFLPMHDFHKQMIVGLLHAKSKKKILQIGLGTGGLPKFIHQTFPDSEVTVVEIFQDVINCAYDFFHLPKDGMIKTVCQDGIEFVKDCQDTFDVVIATAYDDSSSVSYFAESEFLSKISRRLLNPDGLLITSCFTSKPNERAFYRRTSKSLKNCYKGVSMIAKSGNGALFASDSLVGLETAKKSAEALNLEFDLSKYFEQVSEA